MHSAALPALAPTPRLHIHLCIAIAGLPATPELLPACDGSRTARFSPCSPRKGSHRVSDRPNPLRSKPESVFPIPSFLYFPCFTARQKHGTTLIAKSSRDNI